MVTSTLLVDLYDKYKDKTFTPVELTVAALFGDTRLFQTYDPEHEYKRGDRLPYITEDGEFVIIIALKDTTGKFNPLLWEIYDVLSELQGLYHDQIVLSWDEPSLRRNKVWLKIKDESLQKARENNIDDSLNIMVYKNFVISERTPTIFDTSTMWGKAEELPKESR